ncbi:relaxase/mobilization nuclease domain-containing protein [Magnetospirillum sp. SS-4]|uniref:relaxase/mobilization nuclease domain-containing protein n=1 Tax=Magnetospirillum sp. SS-4 TaxID=2681465 RepID=UPI00137FF9F6|nr:relaxase/mobilization nuclease domain-containing protein [Magnetospirillum sp. SS-4]CAA7619040.1 conserved hypothetical protein [Magnetospirillum sp. SS-4]
MIIKGSSRGHDWRDVRRLADHLLAAENEVAEVLEIDGTVSMDLHAALKEMRAISLGTRCRKPLYHASINLDRAEVGTMSPDMWREAVDELGKRLGMAGHQRVVIRHVKAGREHVHIVWSRVDPATLKVASDSHNYRKHEQCARALEDRWNLRRVVGAHTRPETTPRPVAVATHSDWQASVRTGVSVASVAARIQDAWSASRDGHEFGVKLRKRSLCLASARRGIVVVDEAGTPHSIGRRLGIKAVEVQRKLADVDVRQLPTVDEVKARTKRIHNLTGRKRMKSKKDLPGIAPTWGDSGPPDWESIERYWREIGHQPEKRWDAVWIWLDGGWITDYGDRLVIDGAGMPTDKQILAIIQAGRDRGWTGIRFFGSEEYQYRARTIAMKHNLFRPDQISLDCEVGKGGGTPSAPKDPMPEHVRKTLGLPDPNAPPRRPPPPRNGNRARDNGQDRRGQVGKPARPKANDQPMTARDLADLGLDEAPADFGPND